MPGIYERIKSNIGEDTERIPVQIISSALVLYATGTYSRSQILVALNAYLESDLTADEQLDLGLLADEVDGISGDDAKQTYIGKLDAILIATEFGLVNEPQFRSVAGIS